MNIDSGDKKGKTLKTDLNLIIFDKMKSYIKNNIEK